MNAKIDKDTFFEATRTYMETLGLDYMATTSFTVEPTIVKATVVTDKDEVNDHIIRTDRESGVTVHDVYVTVSSD